MGLVSGSKSIQNLVSCSGGITRRLLGKASGNSLTTGTNTMKGFSESKTLKITM